MKTSLKAALAALVILSATAAHADSELNYNYLEAGVGVWSPTGQTFVGPDIRLSGALTENVFLYGGGRYLKDDFKYINYHAGVGYRFIINQQTDIWTGVNYEYQEARISCSSWMGRCKADDNTVAFRGGIRHMVNADVEIGASARLITGDFDYFGMSAHARYNLNSKIALKGEVDVQDGDIGGFAGFTIFF